MPPPEFVLRVHSHDLLKFRYFSSEEWRHLSAIFSTDLPLGGNLLLEIGGLSLSDSLQLSTLQSVSQSYHLLCADDSQYLEIAVRSW